MLIPTRPSTGCLRRGVTTDTQPLPSNVPLASPRRDLQWRKCTSNVVIKIGAAFCFKTMTAGNMTHSAAANNSKTTSLRIYASMWYCSAIQQATARAQQDYREETSATLMKERKNPVPPLVINVARSADHGSRLHLSSSCR